MTVKVWIHSVFCLALTGLGCSETVTSQGPPDASDVTTPPSDVPVAPPSDMPITPPTDVPTVADVSAPRDVPPITDTAVPTGDGGPLPRFSFFVTSLRALQELSGNQNGFGGDLRYGETGPGAGLRGADRICAAIAERSMPGASRKQWRAFLSASNGGDGQPAHAIDRVGNGPWYDRLGRLFANSREDFLSFRPRAADPLIQNDLPNEDGVPNHRPDPTQGQVDNHDTLTGSNAQGRLYNATATCLDWTSAMGNRTLEGRPRVGHTWPRNGGRPPGGGRDAGTGSNVDGYGHWISSLDEAGCAPGVSLIEMGGPILSMPTVGSGGGYGGFYCFALTP